MSRSKKSYASRLAFLVILALATIACHHKKHSVARVPPPPAPRIPPTGSSSAPQTTAPAPLPIPYAEEGIASWYGIPFNGRRAADGEIYDMETLVAAHRLMPFNTWLRVTNLTNGKFVTVRIIDRGPFVEGRIIDLSKAAARQIDMLGPGTTRVRLEVVAAPRDIPANDFYAVQVGSFSIYSNAEQARAQYAQRYGSAQIEARNGPVTRWRVLVGKFNSVEAARQLANIVSADNPDIFIVRLDEAPVNPSLVPSPAH